MENSNLKIKRKKAEARNRRIKILALQKTMTLTGPPKNHDVDLGRYSKIIVAFSGGKDSTAAFLLLLDLGVPKDKIELWHHLIDGREGSTLMDWPVTEDYVREFGKAFGVRTFFSWKEGGFEREMLREKDATAPTYFEKCKDDSDDNMVECGLEVLSSGGAGPEGTRLKFPQVSANLSVRWCSAYLKIDVAASAIRNQVRFNNTKTLVITGERAEESAARSKYKIFEPDRADNRLGRTRRWVDHWRNVHDWSEKQVWDIIEKHKVLAHPAYRLGWGRLSCMKCIFGSHNQWATIEAIDPVGLKAVYDYEEQFGLTIHRNLNIKESIKKGSCYPEALNKPILQAALSTKYNLPIFTDEWTLPAGAFGESNGPT